ncbi:MAG: molecular chaperone DnaK [Actinomycetota bacterium]|nr:molecular chaperone DnaK [Actinomycetota bacterium]
MHSGDPTVLAVDLGTESCRAQLITAETESSVPDPVPGSGPDWPSSVALEEQRLVVGNAAERVGALYPTRYRNHIKQLLATGLPASLAGNLYSAHELVAALLTSIREQAEKNCGHRVTQAVLSVPGGGDAEDPRPSAIRKAAQAAGLDAVRVVLEPVAALDGIVESQQFNHGDIVVVCDFGAGAFQAHIVLCDHGVGWPEGHGRHHVLTGVELPECGGVELDHVIMQELAFRRGNPLSSLVKPAHLPGRRDRTQPALRSFQAAAKDLKHQVVARGSGSFLLQPDQIRVEFTDEQLISAGAPLLHHAALATRELLVGRGLSPSDVAGLLLIGGGARMPVIGPIFSQLIPRPFRMAADPDRTILSGLVVAARQWPARV